MKCPYIVNVEQVTQDLAEYDDSGNRTFHEEKLFVKQYPVECAGAECGAFRDGGCRYADAG